ncbi:MAG: tetratricopeptide repeat-containing sensor histidine kinase [Bacteroidales bacterium]|nr:tetratricopeptide repeat-containing sensor histidine kinase [Bacteroidales bacterium]
MMKLRILFISLLCLLKFPGTGQDMYKVDSLITRLSDHVHDSIRCRIMFDIAAEFKATDTINALEYLESGKNIASRLDDMKGMGRYFEILGEMHSYHGYYRLSILDYDRALAYYSEADDDIGYFETLKDKGNVYLFMAEYTQAMNHYNSALDFYRRNNMVKGISRCLNNMGIIYKNQGNYVEALTVYDESVKYLDPEKDPMDIAEAYINMGNVFVYLGSYEKALEYFEMALEIAERENSLKNIALCLSNSGVVQNKCNNYKEAFNLYRRSLDVSEIINDQIQISNCLINLGTNYADMGQPELGLEYVQRGMAIKMELGDERAISNCYIHLAEIHCMLEGYDQAIDLFRTAIPEKKRLGDQEGLVRCYNGMGSVLLDRREYAEARKIVDQSLELAIEISALEHIVQGFRIKREIAVEVGDFRSAYQFAMQQHQYEDSLMDEATSKAVMEMEFRHRAKELERENENLRIQSNLTAELMDKRNAFLKSIIGIAFLLAAGLMLVVHFMRRLRLSSQKLEEKNLVITKQNLKLDTLNRNKDRMMSIIAHDLRGTLGNQLTAIEVLHQIEGDDKAEIDEKKLLGNLKHSASYSLELLENLLHWSRLEENDSYFHPEEVNLNTLITSCISLFDETARNKGLTFQLHTNGTIHCQVDRIMMEIIIRNLVSNAIKFSNNGGIIDINVEIENDQVNLTVTDHGIGMTDEQIDQITNNGGFTRRGTANEKGAGIGLTLVREFTSIHKGKIIIISKPGEGSCFEIVFPCRI